MRLLVPVIAAILLCPAASAVAETSPACATDLAGVDASFTETLERLEAAKDLDNLARCAAFRHHVEVMKAGREVFLRCLTGHDRDENVGQLDVSIDDFLFLINDRSCP